MSSPHTSIAEPVEMNPLRPHLPTRSVPLRRGTRRRGPEHLMSPGTERPRSPEMDASRSLETGSTRLPTPTGGTLGRTSSRTPGGRVPHQAWTEDQGLPSVVTHPPLPVMTCSTPDPETTGDPDTHTTSTPSAFHRGPGNIAGAAGRSGQDDASFTRFKTGRPRGCTSVKPNNHNWHKEGPNPADYRLRPRPYRVEVTQWSLVCQTRRTKKQSTMSPR
jgi:hypothetical protein